MTKGQLGTLDTLISKKNWLEVDDFTLNQRKNLEIFGISDQLAIGKW